jgi:hypothetical protein
MTVGSGGVIYEKQVLTEVRKQLKNVKGFSIKEGASTAAFSAHEPDLVLLAHSRPLNIEIKQDSKAQMGGTSYNYDMKTKKFTQGGKSDIDPDLDKLFKKMLKTKSADLDKLLNYAKKNDIPELTKNVKGLPLTATKPMWEELTSKKLLVPLNSKIEAPIDFLYDHYEEKNCFYIQIGGGGFYYLKRNPLKLPIPQLQMTFNIELRLGRSGSSYRSSLKAEVASGNIRVQGRLGGKISPSPYSLDNKNHFTELFGSITAAKVKTL